MAKQSRWPVAFNADDEETFAYIFDELRRLVQVEAAAMELIGIVECVSD